MNRIRSAISIAVSVLALAACSKAPPAAQDDATAGVAPAAAPAADVTAALDNGPGLKAGLWQTTVKVKGMTSGMVTKMCLDEGLSKKFSEMGTSNPGKMDCAPVSASRNGGVIDVTTKCTSEGLTVNNQMHMEMTGDDSYHQTVTQTYEPAMAEPTMSTMDGKYLGACTADMRPGDLIMGSGVKINMYDHKAKS